MPKINQKNFLGMVAKGDVRDLNPDNCFQQKNAHSYPGLFKTRPGYKKLNFAAVSGAVNLIYNFKPRAIGQMNVPGFDIVGSNYPAGGGITIAAFGGSLYYIPKWMWSLSFLYLPGFPECVFYDEDNEFFYIGFSTPSYILKTKWDGTEQTTSAETKNVSGVYFDNTENFIYYSDLDDDCIVKMKFDGTEKTTLGSLGAGTKQFNNPSLGYYDSSTGLCYIADYGNDRIVETDISGDNWTTLTNANISGPLDVHYDPTSALVTIASYTNKKIVQSEMDGTGLTALDVFALGSYRPRGVRYDGSNWIYFCDYVNRKVVKVRITGAGLDEISYAGVLEYPQRMHLDSNGYIYIADKGSVKDIIRVKF